MRALIQRVRHASVTVEGEVTGSCGKGLLVLLGVGHGDDEAVADKLWDKILGLRIFEDEAGKTNLSLANVGGEALIVSQFTLYANCRRGRRPSFTDAAAPDVASTLYEHLCERAEQSLGAGHVGRGVFGAMMDVALVNDGPFTIWLDTDEL
ncbi:D-aminoacyl-tRNA deacylase [uncultured Parolsenella sp.]|uniref:D-aminoacyl-tRNA deacylase n=1 Tax=uncultured Parolsenella sp. TaxID=2083008 RepID=UPI0025FB792A|nr:D-aminoacyl-tRNA deacylase [uncultured Parolsenella sp.]